MPSILIYWLLLSMSLLTKKIEVKDPGNVTLCDGQKRLKRSVQVPGKLIAQYRSTDPSQQLLHEEVSEEKLQELFGENFVRYVRAKGI